MLSAVLLCADASLQTPVALLARDLIVWSVMPVEQETQSAVPDAAVLTGSDARNDFRFPPLPFSAFAHLEGDRAIVMLHGELDDRGGVGLVS